VQKLVPRSRVRIFRNERTPSTPLDPKLMFWGVSYYFCAFGAVCCLTKLGAKWTELVQKFVLRSRDRIFRNERTRSTPLDPKLMSWGILYCLCAFRAVWLPYETRCKTDRTVQKFVPRRRIGIFQNERTQSTTLDPKLMFWCILYYLGAFGTIWLPYETRCKMG
jgi:hypothetical protein